MPERLEGVRGELPPSLQSKGRGGEGAGTPATESEVSPSPPAILRAWLDAGTPAAILRRWLQPGEQRPRERLLGAERRR